MKELQTYQKRVKSDGSLILSLETEPIDDDEIFILETIGGYHDNQATTEVTRFYFTAGGNPYIFGVYVPKATGVQVTMCERITIPTGYSFGVNCPNAANGEWIHLYVHGRLMPLDKYRELYLIK